jgi:hypothetical protein
MSSPKLIGRGSSNKKRKLSEPTVSEGGVVYLKGGEGYDSHISQYEDNFTAKIAIRKRSSFKQRRNST